MFFKGQKHEEVLSEITRADQECSNLFRAVRKLFGMGAVPIEKLMHTDAVNHLVLDRCEQALDILEEAKDPNAPFIDPIAQ